MSLLKGVLVLGMVIPEHIKWVRSSGYGTKSI
jgi:hypothetical protein